MRGRERREKSKETEQRKRKCISGEMEERRGGGMKRPENEDVESLPTAAGMRE